jgi:prepilin-type N-terminal cleavage/methylation domain-containing protein/prepilin-type processing-associated H-X9-DG protein
MVVRAASTHAWSRFGVSLIEMIVALGIVGLIASLLLPAIQRAREAAARSGCLNNLRQMGMALHNYYGLHGTFPPPDSASSSAPGGQYTPMSTLNWFTWILPEIDQSPLWDASQAAFLSDPTTFHNPPHAALSVALKAYVCPDDTRLLSPLVDRDGIEAAYTSYLGVSGALGFKDGVLVRFTTGVRLTDITDGTSRTLMVGERPPPDTLQAGWWYTWERPDGYWGNLYGPDGVSPAAAASVTPGEVCLPPFLFGPGVTSNPCDRLHFWSLHPGGANFLVADGSARFLPYAASPIIAALATRAGDESVDMPE